MEIGKRDAFWRAFPGVISAQNAMRGLAAPENGMQRLPWWLTEGAMTGMDGGRFLSTAKVIQNLSEQVLQRKAAGHLDPNLADRDPDLSADFEQP